MRGYVLRRKDSNQTELVKCLRKLGARVHIWGQEADLIVQLGGMTMICEVRPPSVEKKPREGRQERFQGEFMVYWLQSTEDCQALVKTLRRWQDSISGRG